MSLEPIAMTPLEERLKQILQQRPDMQNHIPTGEELSVYISWMAETFSSGNLTLNTLPVFIGNTTQSRLAGRVLQNPRDKQALEQLSRGYQVQSEQQYIMSNHDIHVSRMLRYIPGQWHSSDYFEIYYAPCGNCPISFEEETISLSHGAVLIVSPGILHASPCYADEAILHYFLVRSSTFERVFYNQLPENSLLLSFFHKALNGENNASWLYFDTREDERLFQLTRRMDQEYQKPGSYSAQLLNALLTEFFILTLMDYESTARLPRTEDFYWKHEYSAILSYIQQHYTEATLEDVGQEFHYSSRQISRIVKSCLGLTYAQLVMKLKMEKAAELLGQGTVSIPAISRSLGYSEPSSFYHAYTSYYGTTPRAAGRRHSTEDI